MNGITFFFGERKAASSLWEEWVPTFPIAQKEEYVEDMQGERELL